MLNIIRSWCSQGTSSVLSCAKTWPIASNKGDKTRNISDGQGRYTHQLTEASQAGTRPSSLHSQPTQRHGSGGPHLRREPPNSTEILFYSSSSYFSVFWLWLLLLRWPQIYKEDKDRLVSIWFPYMVPVMRKTLSPHPLHTRTRETENGHHHCGCSIDARDEKLDFWIFFDSHSKNGALFADDVLEDKDVFCVYYWLLMAIVICFLWLLLLFW